MGLLYVFDLWEVFLRVDFLIHMQSTLLFLYLMNVHL